MCCRKSRLERDYDVFEQIGIGSYGIVRKVRRKRPKSSKNVEEDDYLVVKMCRNVENLRFFLAEIEKMKKIDHFNVVKYVDSFFVPPPERKTRCCPKRENQIVCIVMEYCEGGDLKKFIRQAKLNKAWMAEDQLLQMAK